MFHAGTPDSAKKLILEDIAKSDGFIRVLVCTVAFGMGINCKQVHRIIHFGPSVNMESYIQECGRAGRDGKESTCILLHNGLLSSHALPEMKEFIAKETCKRKEILKHFPGCGQTKITVSGCRCCNICAKNCRCKGLPGMCSVSLSLVFTEETKEPYKFNKSRAVTPEQKATLEKKLLTYMHKLRSNTQTPVLFPNVQLEFGKYHISQILSRCSRLFSLTDIYSCVEVWKAEYAQQVLNIISETFKDIDHTDLDFESDEQMDWLEDCIHCDWEDVRDDSTMCLLSMNDTGNLSSISMAMHALDKSDDCDEELDQSSIQTQTSLATEASQRIQVDE
jgi:hypothetical protein